MHLIEKVVLLCPTRARKVVKHSFSIKLDNFKTELQTKCEDATAGYLGLEEVEIVKKVINLVDYRLTGVNSYINKLSFVTYGGLLTKGGGKNGQW